MQVIGYTRVSTEEQSSSGLGLAAQRSTIAAEAERRGWTVTWVEDAGYSAKNLHRPGIAEALDELRAGRAEALVVAKLDRVTRSTTDFGNILETAQRERWAFVALDLGVDTTTAAGELVANVMASIAQWERKVIGERTTSALAEKRRQGVRLGRPVLVPDQVRRRILRARKAGKSYRTIAEDLNGAGIPTAQGGARWYASTVRAVEGRAA